VTRGLLDTSVFIAQEGRQLDGSALPDEIAVSVVTYGELRAGVPAASDAAVRSRRLTMLQAVSDLNHRPSTLQGGRRVGVACASRGPGPADEVNWIAATALAHEVPAVTQDADFDVLAEISDLRVITL
jgi:predicted nucleic acid-binding protein